MTEQEAVRRLEYLKIKCGLPDQGHAWKPNAETIALDIAISTLEEILRHRAAGTAAGCRKAEE